MKETAKVYKEIIENYSGPGLRIMEVCGTHTHEIFRLGIRKILPESVELISGPGCPVCVTPIGYIDEAVILAKEKGAVICTFGDLIRVPGTHASLADARADGAKIRMVYTPLDAVEYAAQHPQEQVVFLAVGFETTTPAVCLAVKRAEEQSLTNFSLLVANKTMPGAYVTLKGSADAFLYPGHVHAIIGEQICRRLAKEEGISGVIAGFTAEELLHAVAMIIKNVKAGENDPQFLILTIVIHVWYVRRAMKRPAVSSKNIWKAATVNGGGSVSFRTPDCVFVRNIGITMRGFDLDCPTSRGNRILPVGVEMYYRENANHPTVVCLGAAVPRSIRLEHAWSPMRGHVRHFISTGYRYKYGILFRLFDILSTFMAEGTGIVRRDDYWKIR